MHAEIHYSHNNMSSQRDPIISTEVRHHLRQMDRENDDAAGHLLADSLGGAGEPFNFAPQIGGNVVVPSSWYDVEALIHSYLIDTSGGGYVRWSTHGFLVVYSILRRLRWRCYPRILLSQCSYCSL